MIGYEGFDQRQENEQYRIHVGVVATVDAEKQTMSVNIPGVGQVPDIYINNAVSLTGSGVRVMPVPSITRALIYEQKSIFYHIGTYHNAVGDDNINLGLAPYTNDSNGNKNTNDEVVLQRYVDAGEVCITGYSSAEIYLPLRGTFQVVAACSGFRRQKRRRLARQRRDGRSRPPSHKRICRSASSFFTPASLSRCASSSSRPISAPG